MRNPLNQKDHDDILSSIQFHQLTCTCGHSACLSVHGYYLRGLKTPDGIIRLRICRLRCHECRRTHALRSLLDRIPICPLKELVSLCFSACCLQFMQVIRTPDILFPLTT